MALPITVKRVGILMNPTKPNADKIRRELSDWLVKRNLEALDASQISV